MYLKIFLLSLIQSLTEFLPVSSTAHLIIFGKYLKLSENIAIYSIVIQLASALALLIYFRKKIISTTLTLYNDKNSQNFAYKIFLGFFPCAVVGLFVYKYIKNFYNTNFVIAVALIVGGIVFLILDKLKLKAKYSNIDKMTKVSALKIGLFQIFALIPGVSRSGSTMIGGVLSGLSRKTAVEFSFLLAIPTIFLASLYEIYKSYAILTFLDIKLLIFAFFSTFIMSSLVIKLFLDYISKHNWAIFGYYRILIGLIILYITLF